MKLSCLFKGHEWTEWRMWYVGKPRIVFASIEYLNDPTEVRECRRCGKHQAEYGWKHRP